MKRGCQPFDATGGHEPIGIRRHRHDVDLVQQHVVQFREDLGALRGVHFRGCAVNERWLCSGWGTRADWYGSIQARRPRGVRTGGKRWERAEIRYSLPTRIQGSLADFITRLSLDATALAYRLARQVILIAVVDKSLAKPHF
jgi:hypothetical protein